MEGRHRQRWTSPQAGASALPSLAPSDFCSTSPTPPTPRCRKGSREPWCSQKEAEEVEGLTGELTSRPERR